MLLKHKSGLVAVLIVAAMTGSWLNVAPASAATSYVEGTDAGAALFNPLMVNDFSMQMSQEDFDSLRSPNVNWEYEGDWRETQMNFTMAGKTYGPYTVGVHLKGAWGSWRDVTGKAAFKIKMDAFVRGQTLFGISRITLNNMVQDNSYVHESLTYRLFRNLGIPAPRTGYANVSLNGINYGLHLNVETVNKQMLKRWGVTSSHLYKGAVPYFPDFYRNTEWTFAVESGSATDVTDLTDFIAIQELAGENWWNEMSRVTDMELLTLSWATEYYTGHWDGYAVNRNNYFVNFDSDGKVLMVPWGVDQTWGGYLDYFSSPAIMTNKCFSYDPCLETYRQSMAKVSRIAKSLDLSGMSRNVASAIEAAVISDPFGPGISTAESYQNYLLWNLREQQRILSSIVQPFDTTVSSVRVNNISFAPGRQITLPPDTKTINLSVTTTQLAARATVQPIGSLKPGLNTALVFVTSADKKHTNPTKVSIYILSNQSKKTSVLFHPNSSVPTFSGISSTGLLATNLDSVSNLVLEIKMLKPKTQSASKANAQMAARVKHLIASLASRGVKPAKVTQVLTSTGAANALVVNAKYVK